MKDPLHQHKQMLKVFATTQILLEQLDELKSTSLYAKEMKQHTKRYADFLEQHSKHHMSNLYKIDDDLFVSIQKGAEQIINAIIEEVQ